MFISYFWKSGICERWGLNLRTELLVDRSGVNILPATQSLPQTQNSIIYSRHPNARLNV
jgi:hypothetical protein